MSNDPPVHRSLEEVEEGVEVIRDTGANPSRTVPSRPTVEPTKAEEEHKEKEDHAA